MNRTNGERLRAKLGESIPVGGTEADTMFTNDEIDDLLEEGFGNINAATYHGWVEKAGNYANLVTVSEGNASRELTELHRHALRMMDRFIGYVTTPGRGRARIGRLVRETG